MDGFFIKRDSFIQTNELSENPVKEIHAAGL